MTDFQFTKPEIEQVKLWAGKGWSPFVNCNAKTRLKKIGFPIIATVTPDVVKFVRPKGNLFDLKAIRLKVVDTEDKKIQNEYVKALGWAAIHNIEVLVTLMRFNKRTTGEACSWIEDHYKWGANWYKLQSPWKGDLFTWAMENQSYICDKKNKGCPSCRNCSRITYGLFDGPIWGLDLSASGSCPYSCPDCWSKATLIRTQGRILWDKPKQNSKQKGK